MIVTVRGRLVTIPGDTGYFLVDPAIHIHVCCLSVIIN